MSKLKHLSIGMEAIDFQGGAFYKELVLVFQQYVGKGEPTKKSCNEMSGVLETIIARHTGINSKVEFNHHGTCIWVPDIDGGNVLLGEYRYWMSSDDGLKMIDKFKGRSSGQVDLKNGRVSGDFSKYEARINIDLGHFTSQQFTDEEIAAVLLHEIGHYFSYCEMLDRTVCGNLILVGLDKALRNAGNDVKKREYVLERAAKAADFKREVIENVKKSSDDKTVMTVFVAEMNDGTRSLSGDSFYDLNSWEMSADQFAARHGAGRALVTALDKLYAKYGASVTQGKFTYYFFEVFKIVQWVLSIGAGALFIAAGGGAAILGVLFLALSYGSLRTAHLNDGTPTYDKPINRAQRVRRQLVEATKNSNLPKEVVKTLIDDIKLIDETTAKYVDRTPWLETLDNYLFKSSRIRRDNVKFQQELEKLALNDLFVSSAAFKTL